jgi:hypothetical protein
MKTTFEWLKMLGVILAVILLGELPVVKSISLEMKRSRRAGNTTGTLVDLNCAFAD